jgi:hypothetical protein
VAAAEAAAPGNNAVGFVAETDTFYRYLSADASNAVRDAKVILNTGAGGTTRWVAVAGRYGNIANSVLPIRNNPTYGSSTNTFLGKESLGQYYGALTTGSHNVTLGYNSGNRISSGSQNTYCGAGSGSNLVGTFSSNIILGTSPATSCQFTAGILVGRNLMSYSDTRAVNPIAIGDQVGTIYTATRPGTDVILAGYGSGKGRCATRTIAIGYEAAKTGSYPGDNLCLGAGAGATLNVYTGTRNILLAASVVTSGSRNVLCGPYANSKVTTGSDNVIVHPRSYLGGGSVYADVNLTGVIAGGYNSADVGNYTVSFGYQVLSQSGINPNKFPGNIGFGFEALKGGSGGANQGVGPCNIGFGLEVGKGLLRPPAETGAEDNILFGCQTAQWSVKASRNIYFGYHVGWGMDKEREAWSTPYGSDYSSSNIAIGRRALEYSQDFTYTPNIDHFNVICGHLAGADIRSAFCCTYLGGTTGGVNKNGDNNTCLGYGSGTALSLLSMTRWTYKTIYDRDHTGTLWSSEYNGDLCFIEKEGTWWYYDIPEPPVPNYQSSPTWYEVEPPSEATLVGSGATTTTSGVRLGLVGAVTVHGGAYTTDSDIRLKTSIEDCDLGLDFIRALRPRRFCLKASPQGPIHHGFIAQEVAQSLGDMESNIWSKPVSKDDMQAVSYEAMIAPLTRAIQELAAEAVALQARIQILKNGGSCGPKTLQADA